MNIIHFVFVYSDKMQHKTKNRKKKKSNTEIAQWFWSHVVFWVIRKRNIEFNWMHFYFYRIVFFFFVRSMCCAFKWLHLHFLLLFFSFLTKWNQIKYMPSATNAWIDTDKIWIERIFVFFLCLRYSPAANTFYF